MSLPVSRRSRAWLAWPACLAAGLAALPAVGAGPVTRTLPPAVAMRQLSRQPMSFEQNTGRFDPRVRFVARSGGATLFLTDSNVTMVLPGKPKGDPKTAMRNDKPIERGPGHVLRMKLVGAHTPSSVTGLDKQARVVNYFIGKDPAKWRTHVPTFGRARFAGVYPGTDLVYYGNNGRMEYDFMVKPGADPGKIRLAFEGADDLRIAANGDLLARTPVGDVQLQRPYAYQAVNGKRVQVACGYSMAPGSRQVAFRTARYDTTRPLVVDPSIKSCTYAGGTANDFLCGVGVLSTNAIVAAGYTASTNYPVTAGALYGIGGGGGYDAVVTGINLNGSGVFSTYLGGAGIDEAPRVAVDSADAIYLCGQTASPTYPTTVGAYQTAMKGSSDWFVTKLTSNGSALVYSTFLGGTGLEEGSVTQGVGGIAVNSSGEAVVALITSSTDFPVTAGTVQTTKSTGNDIAVARLNAAGSGVLAATYYGGNNTDCPIAIALGPNDDVYVGGHTQSTNFPTSSGAFQATKVGSTAGFVIRMNSALTTLRYATLFESPTASAQSRVCSIAPDVDGSAYVGGYCVDGFPVTNGAFQTASGTGTSGVIGRVKPDGTGLAYATYVSAASSVYVYQLLLLDSGDLLAAGFTSATNMPTTSYAFKKSGGGSNDGYLAILDPTLSACRYMTYFGGTSTDYLVGAAARGSTLGVVGYTSGGLTTTTGAFQKTFSTGSTYDGFIAGISLAPATSVLSVANKSGGAGAALTLTATLTCGGSAVPGKGVDITVAGLLAGSATTDASGVASVAYTIPAGTSGGDYAIGAYYEGEAYLAGTTAGGKLTVNAAATSMAVADASGAPGRSVTLTGTLTSGGSGIAGKTVSFQVSGVAVGSGTTNASGVATYSYAIPADTTSGGKTITGTFAGDGAYATSTSSGTLTVNKITSELSATDTTGVIGAEATLTATLKASGSRFAAQSISFTVDGASVGSGTTDASGVASCSYTIASGTAVGDHTIGVAYAGDTTYAPSSAAAKLTVNKITTTLSATDAAGVPSQTTTLTATLTADGAGLAGKSVSFTVAGSSAGSGTTDSNGVAVVTYTVPGNTLVGNKAIFASFAGDTDTKPATGSATLSVDTIATTLAASAPEDLSAGAYETVSGTLTQATGGTAISGKTISFTLGSTAIGTATTDATGKAALEFLVPETLATGGATLNASFAGTSAYASADGAAQTSIVAGQTNGYAAPATGKRGDRVKLYCYLYRNVEPRDMLAGKAIAITVDGAQVGYGTTDRNGRLTVNWTIPGSITPGVHALAYTFAGDSHYSAWTGTKALTVTSRADLFAGSMPDGSPGATVTLYAYLYDKVSGEAYAGQELSFLVDGVAVGAGTTDALGKATVSYTIPADMPLGNHAITVNFAGNAGYPAATGTGKLVVLEKAVTAMYVRSYPLAVAGQKLKLYCYLYQKQGKVMLAGKTVTINVDGVDVATPTTDANGYAQYLYTVPSGSATHVVSISFAGDAENKAVSGTGAVIVP